MAAFTEGANFSTSANGKTLDPRLLDILKTAAAQYGMDVQATSGVQGRSTGTKNHPGGYAVDIKLIGPDGKALPNYQNAKSFPAYEKFAQTARVVQQQKYPELDNVFRWGGYFAGGPNPMDLMHFDINPNLHGAMAGGSWDGGVTSSYAKARGITTYNPGLATVEGQRQVASIKQGLAGGPLPPMNIPQVGTALDVIDRVAPRPMPSSIASAYAAQPKASSPPLPVARPRNIDNGGFNLAPPSLPLNAPLPANRGASYGPNTGQWGPKVGQLGLPPFAAQTYQPGMMGRGQPLPPPVAAPTRQQTLSEQQYARTLASPPVSRLSHYGDPTASLPGPTFSEPPVPAGGYREAPIAAPTEQQQRYEQLMTRAMFGPKAALPLAPLNDKVRVISVNPDGSPVLDAPIPMPGRPASRMPAPPAPVQVPTPQLPAPRQIGPVAPPAAPQLRLASGKTIAPGVYDQGDHSVRVSDDGNGNAVIERVRGPMSIPGVIDPLREANANTLAGGMIRKMLPGQLAGDASAFVPTVTDNVKSAAVNAASNLGNSIGGMFGGLFGAKPTRWVPWGSIPALPSAPMVRAPVPMSRPLSFFAQPQAAPVASQPRPAAPGPSNGGGYAYGKQSAINDTLRTLGFNV